MQSQLLSSVETGRRLFYAVAAIVLLLALGMLGFRYIEGYNWIESLYIAAQTVTTVGYGDLPPKTDAGRLFSTVFILLGAGTVLYALTTVAQAVFQSEMLTLLGARRKTKEMNNLRDHYIVCGAGRVGRRIISQLQRQKIPFVVIERDEGKVAHLVESGAHVIIDDATLETNLQQAGVERAKGLATCLADDAANVYVVLTARGLNDKLHIVARAVEEQAEPKLVRAGANRVVAPTIIGSQSMARALLKPAIADFMDSIVAENLDLVFEEVAIENDSCYVGKPLKDTNLRSELDIVIVAIRHKNGEMSFHPSGEDIINEGDLLIVIGRAESMAKLIEFCK